jgi:hypothetical protein
MAGKIACRRRSLNASLKSELQNKIIIFIKEFRARKVKTAPAPKPL